MNSTPQQPPAPTLVDTVLDELHALLKSDSSGRLADYIPELAKADPAHFGIVIATVDGSLYAVGDSGVPFTIQSISKPFVYGLALEDHGRDAVLRKVGVEPSGDAFNSILFDERHNRPFNPMVNAGAIATSALIKGDGGAERLARVQAMFARYIGHGVPLDRGVFESEKATGHRNRAIAHLELNYGMIDGRLEEHLDLYFQQCSLLVDCRDLAVMAATLANGGVNPMTAERALDPSYVKNVISVMSSCGMYNYSGEWSYRIGLPAKSGVGGGIIAVLPGRMGIGVFSPLLDARGNSVRGIQVCEILSQRFGLNMFDSTKGYASSIRRHYDGLSITSNRHRTAREQSTLETLGWRIAVLELRGTLNFASIEQIARLFASLRESVTHLILDFSHVDQIEPQAAPLVKSLIASQNAARRQVFLAHLRPDMAQHQLLLAAELAESSFFPDLDQALEWAEEQVLDEHPDRELAAGELALADMELVAGLGPELLGLLDAALVRHEFPAGSMVMREGDPATHLYFLAKGSVSVQLNTSEGRTRRLTTLDPGVAFGEMALLDGNSRSANIQANSDIIVYALPLEQLAAASPKAHPVIQSTLLRNLGRQLSLNLRRANKEIAALR